MARPGVAAGQLDRRSATPSVGQDLAQVVADGEAQLGHGLGALGAPVVRAVVAALVRRLQGVLVDTLGEVQERLQVGAAGGAREAVLVGRDAIVALAHPLDLGVRRGIRGGGGRGGTRDHLQVLRDGDLGRCLAQVVVG